MRFCLKENRGSNVPTAYFLCVCVCAFLVLFVQLKRTLLPCISYLQQYRNDWVRSKINILVGPQEPLQATVKRWKFAWFGHVTWYDSPEPSFRATWRVDDATVSRGTAGWIRSKSGCPCPSQNCWWPSTEKTGRGFLLNPPSCQPDNPISSGTDLTKPKSIRGFINMNGIIIIKIKQKTHGSFQSIYNDNNDQLLYSAILCPTKLNALYFTKTVFLHLKINIRLGGGKLYMRSLNKEEKKLQESWQ